MAFWDEVDRFVGHIPVTSIVKDAIEAGIAEAKGHHGAAKEEVIEAAVIMVSDLVTVTAFGASAEVATAGAIAAEGIFRQAEKGAVKNVGAEAASLCSGRKDDDDVTAVAATQYVRGKDAKAAKVAKEVTEERGIRVSDSVSVAAFEASAEVATAGATAAERIFKHSAIFKQASKGDLKNVAAEATSLGLGRKATDDIMADAATQCARGIAGFEEEKGHHSAAEEVIIASDYVSVAAVGASSEVIKAGKTAVEWFLKNPVKLGVVKIAAEATSLGSGTKAADCVLTAAAASVFARQIVSSEKSCKPVKQVKPKRTSQAKADQSGQTRSVKPNQVSQAKPDGSVKPKPKLKPKPKPKPTQPKRGHHVINNGVIKIIPSIINSCIFENVLQQSYENLEKQNIITSEVAPELMRMLNQPMCKDVCAQIEQMVVYTPKGETYTDENSIGFGLFNLKLRNAVECIVSHIFTSLKNAGEKQPDLSGHEKMQTLINLINYASVSEKEIYVDRQALDWWLDEGAHQKKQFTTCRDSVKNMFDSLVCVENPCEGLVCIWGRETFDIYKRLIKMYNCQPQMEKKDVRE